MDQIDMQRWLHQWGQALDNGMRVGGLKPSPALGYEFSPEFRGNESYVAMVRPAMAKPARNQTGVELPAGASLGDTCYGLDYVLSQPNLTAPMDVTPHAYEGAVKHFEKVMQMLRCYAGGGESAVRKQHTLVDNVPLEAQMMHEVQYAFSARASCFSQQSAAYKLLQKAWASYRKMVLHLESSEPLKEHMEVRKAVSHMQQWICTNGLYEPDAACLSAFHGLLSAVGRAAGVEIKGVANGMSPGELVLALPPGNWEAPEQKEKIHSFLQAVSEGTQKPLRAVRLKNDRLSFILEGAKDALPGLLVADIYRMSRIAAQPAPKDAAIPFHLYPTVIQSGEFATYKLPEKLAQNQEGRAAKMELTLEAIIRETCRVAGVPQPRNVQQQDDEISIFWNYDSPVNNTQMNAMLAGLRAADIFASREDWHTRRVTLKVEGNIPEHFRDVDLADIRAAVAERLREDGPDLESGGYGR